eukprot:c20388_g1_i4.p1 GENE.c20388_g1_i4~~c20388_g1_i4.p1  ORF type:complete len:185 (+),score=54.48 c20388_g1_i4:389-943(+)
MYGHGMAATVDGFAIFGGMTDTGAINRDVLLFNITDNAFEWTNLTGAIWEKFLEDRTEYEAGELKKRQAKVEKVLAWQRRKQELLIAWMVNNTLESAKLSGAAMPNVEEPAEGEDGVVSASSTSGTDAAASADTSTTAEEAISFVEVTSTQDGESDNSADTEIDSQPIFVLPPYRMFHVQVLDL